MTRKLVAQQGGLRHRKDGVPRKLVAQQGGLGAGKMACLGNLWLSKVGTGKMVCLGNLWPAGWSRQRKDGVPRKLVAQ